jgi:glucosylceramidase
MTMTDQQLATVGTMVKNTIGGKPELWAVDHNWSDRPRVDNVLALAPGVFDRAAFHCYAGSPGEMSGLPVAAVMTECTGTSDTWTGTFRWDAANLIMGSIEAGSTGLMMWNLALDPAHGPKRPGGCDNCRGLLTVDPATGAAEPTPEYYALAHIARAADPGARIGGVQHREALTTATFANPDGSIGIIGFNDSSASRTVRFELPNGPSSTFDVPAYSYVSARAVPSGGGL